MMVNEVAEFARVQFEVLRRGLAAIDRGRDAATGAQLFDGTTALLRARECF